MRPPDIANPRAIRHHQRQSPSPPPHPTPTPTGKPAAPPVLATDTAGIPERKATNRVRQMPAKFPTMTAARKHAAKMVSWQCPTKSRQRIISDAAAARSTSHSG